MKITIALALLFIVGVVNADLYMHNPRGSNNRLAEDNDNRQNANRLFDSQNNNRGGYNVGDSNAEQNGDGRGDSLGQLTYFKTSILRVEWTNQHGGNNPNVNTQLVFQYMCNDMSTSLWDVGAGNDLRDGDGSTNANNGNTNRITDETQANYGRHEPQQFFDDCTARDRNGGLVVFDQNVGNNARSTRQNAGATAYGFECAEERDYYPYWHPAPWKDILILTSNTTQCELYQTESQNVQVKGHCVGETQYNNPDECAENGGAWTEEPAWGIAAPRCEELAFSRDNHLGNSVDGEPLHFNWTIPADITAGSKCVLRARYNISTNDYDNWNTFYMEDEDGNSVYPISNDPNLNILKGTGYSAGVQLNVNTAQFGRTFQDRSHVFYVQDRPANIDPAAMIYNLNVRGRRGNIVEVYPSVEYDYIPRDLYVTPADYVHIQWTGSLSSPDGNGQGAAETDKNNMVCIAKAGDSVPLMYSDPACTMFTSLDQHIKYATAGYAGTPDTVDELLNNIPATFNNAADAELVQPGGGALGEYHFLNTRNNHFTNRAQKGTIYVVPGPLLVHTV